MWTGILSFFRPEGFLPHAGTTDLDAFLAFQGEVYQAVVNTRRVKRVPVVELVRALRKISPRIAAGIEFEFNQFEEFLGRPDKAVQYKERMEWAEDLWSRLPESKRMEAIHVFGIWASELAVKGTKLAKAEQQRQETAFYDLYVEVITHFLASPTEGVPNIGIDPNAFIPSDKLLEEAGYEVDSQSRRKRDRGQ